MVKEEIVSPLKNATLAGITNNLFIEKLDEKKLKKLVKMYNKPENCPNMITPKCIRRSGELIYSIQAEDRMT